MHKPISDTVVIIIEDERSIASQEQALALSARTGFAIVKAFNHNVNTKAALHNTAKASTKQHRKKPSTESQHTRLQPSLKALEEEVQATDGPAPWQLVFTEHGLVLRMTFEPSWGDIQVDFNSAALQYRKDKGGGKNEAIAKAIGIKGNPHPLVVDCTAGMGSDSFVMASVGATVRMLERNVVIAALLENGLARGQDDVDIAQKLSLYHQDAADYLHSLKPNSVDVIYLDPMFPHKKKSALVKKEMRAFQLLIGEDLDSERLLKIALNRAKSRVVVKRPNYAEAISLPDGKKPSMAIVSKKHRFDVYLQHC